MTRSSLLDNELITLSPFSKAELITLLFNPFSLSLSAVLKASAISSECFIAPSTALELDEVDFVNKIIYEDKTANGLYIDNPTSPQTEAQWASDKILTKTQKKIDAISKPDFNIIINNNDDVSQYSFMVDELKDIKDIRYRINADTPELRKAVEDSINALKAEYPDYSFSATFGE